jgi:hypothetical protein
MIAGGNKVKVVVNEGGVVEAKEVWSNWVL